MPSLACLFLFMAKIFLFYHEAHALSLPFSSSHGKDNLALSYSACPLPPFQLFPWQRYSCFVVKRMPSLTPATFSAAKIILLCHLAHARSFPPTSSRGKDNLALSFCACPSPGISTCPHLKAYVSNAGMYNCTL